jgi:hypothetical protein
MKIRSYNEFVNESLNEAARIGRSSWNKIIDDLERLGWTERRGKVYKSYTDDDDNERELELDNDGDEIYYTVYDHRGKEIDSGSFDAEGSSAGELDGEVWNYVE